MEHRLATERDLSLLAKWNHQLIRDEGHRNPMTEPDLEARMQAWLQGEYRAVIFENTGEPAAYALFRENDSEVYVRHLFVERSFRRKGVGRKAVEILRGRYWPADKRIVVEVLTKNTKAAAFWRAAGFRDYSLTLEISP